MYFRSIFSIMSWCIALTLFGCGGDSDGTRQLSNRFGQIASYELSDFKLDRDYEYWELRALSRSSVDEYDTFYAFDEEAYQALTDEQKAGIETVSENTSQAMGRDMCPPQGCLVFAVAVSEDDAVSINRQPDLLSFFASIDTVAELHILLWLDSYEAETYEAVSGGYRAIASWDNLCGKRGKDLLFIDHNGVVTTEEELEYSEDQDAPCV